VIVRRKAEIERLLSDYGVPLVEGMAEGRRVGLSGER
jgi:hypothetical protein